MCICTQRPIYSDVILKVIALDDLLNGQRVNRFNTVALIDTGGSGGLESRGEIDPRRVLTGDAS